LPRPLLATGGHLKVTVALAWDRRVVVSPHIGELDSPRSNDVFNQVVSDLQSLYGVTAQVIACDRHPGYASTRWARARAHGQGLPLLPVQHHAAHASALAGEHPDVARWLVFAWDGVGYGDDGSLWGGEALAGRPGAWLRRASFRPFRLAGGDRAGREPWRSAVALLWATGCDLDEAVGANLVRDLPAVGETQGREQGSLLQLAHDAWLRGINTHESSAVGRLFDAAAALVLGRQTASFEGQGPMELEAIAADGCLPLSLPLAADGQGVLRSDWAPLLTTLTNVAIAPAERAGIFHETLAQALLDQVVAIRATTAFDAVGLSGGVFQNKRLTERVVARLGQAGIDVRLHEAVPANDGGLSFGQVIETAARLQADRAPRAPGSRAQGPDRHPGSRAAAIRDP
jgi:hydrogenase maturation protein HypF